MLASENVETRADSGPIQLERVITPSVASTTTNKPYPTAPKH